MQMWWSNTWKDVNRRQQATPEAKHISCVHPYFARAATWVVIWDHDQGGGTPDSAALNFNNTFSKTLPKFPYLRRAVRRRMSRPSMSENQALNQEARAFEKQGALDDALRSAQEAARISEAAGERAEVAKALTITGIVRFDQGNFTEAAGAYNRALAMQREIGDMRATATTLNDLANALGEQGDLSGSIKMLNQALATFREVGDKHSAAAVLGSIAARTLQQAT